MAEVGPRRETIAPRVRSSVEGPRERLELRPAPVRRDTDVHRAKLTRDHQSGGSRFGAPHRTARGKAITRIAPSLDGFDGYEAIAFAGDDAYVAIELRTTSGAVGYLLRARAHGTPLPAEDAEAAERSPAPLVVEGADGNALALRLIDAGLLPPR